MATPQGMSPTAQGADHGEQTICLYVNRHGQGLSVTAWPPPLNSGEYTKIASPWQALLNMGQAFFKPSQLGLSPQDCANKFARATDKDFHKALKFLLEFREPDLSGRKNGTPRSQILLQKDIQ